MIDLASFFTVKTPGQIPGQGIVTPQTSEGGELDSQLALLKLIAANNGKAAEEDSSEGGLSIFDILLSTIEDTIANGDEPITSEEFQALQSDNPLLDKDPKLDLIKILAGNDKIAEEVEGLDEIVGLELIEKARHGID